MSECKARITIGPDGRYTLKCEKCGQEREGLAFEVTRPSDGWANEHVGWSINYICKRKEGRARRPPRADRKVTGSAPCSQ